MFDKLKISNFQSHQDAELVFHPGVNAIVGKSNSGKTAIFRAIKLLSTNRPLGHRYHSNFADDSPSTEPTKVELQLDNGNTVSTTRGANTEYSVNGESFKGFGATVPDVVRKVLNLSDLNLQDQLEAHFLICSSPGEVARTINKVIRVDEVDGWVSSLTTLTNSEQSELKALESDILELRTSLTSYDYLEGFEKCVAVVESIENRLVEKTDQIQQLTQILRQLEEVRKSLEQTSKKLLLEENVRELEELQKQILVVSDKIVVLSDYVGVNEKIKTLEKFVKIMEPGLDSVTEIFDKIKSVVNKERVISSIVSDLSVYQSNLDIAKVNIDSLRREMFYFLTSLNRCPTCFTKLSAIAIKEIIAN